jgi:hypothetical protein
MEPKDNPPTSEEIYQSALHTAYRKWMELQDIERRIIIEKKQLRQTFLALWPLAYPDQETTDVNSMSLANAIRLIVGGLDRPVTPTEMRGKLTDLGFDLSKYENPMANIHTTMNRMVDSEEMQWLDIETNKKAIPGPELKSVQPPLPPRTDDPVKNGILVIMNSAVPTEDKKQ